MRIETRSIVDDILDMDSLSTSLAQHLDRIRNEGGRIISVIPNPDNKVNEHQYYTVIIEFD